jgi:hypothetical protein
MSVTYNFVISRVYQTLGFYILEWNIKTLKQIGHYVTLLVQF